MFSKTSIALAAASLALSAAAFTPASANYSYCTENPSAAKCPGNYDISRQQGNMTAHSDQGTEPQTHHPRHHG